MTEMADLRAGGRPRELRARRSDDPPPRPSARSLPGRHAVASEPGLTAAIGVAGADPGGPTTGDQKTATRPRPAPDRPRPDRGGDRECARQRVPWSGRRHRRRCDRHRGHRHADIAGARSDTSPGIVQLGPGETAPPKAIVQQAPAPTPRVVTVTTRQSGQVMTSLAFELDDHETPAPEGDPRDLVSRTAALMGGRVGIHVVPAEGWSPDAAGRPPTPCSAASARGPTGSRASIRPPSSAA